MRTVIIIILSVIFASCEDESKLVIKPLFPYVSAFKFPSSEDSAKGRYYFAEHFNGYEIDSTLFDSVVKHDIDPDYAKYTSYDIYFYNKTDRLNENYKDSGYDFYFNDQLVRYHWALGEFVYATDYKVSGYPGGKSYFKKGSPIFNSMLNGDYSKPVQEDTFKAVLEMPK